MPSRHRRLAGTALRSVEGYLRHAAALDQIVGKIRLVQTPWLNHSWHVVLYVTPRGLTTSPIPVWRAQLPARLRLSSTMCCASRPAMARKRRSGSTRGRVADFYANVMRSLAELGIEVRINELPNEIPDADPIQRRSRPRRPTTAISPQRFWRMLCFSRARVLVPVPHRLHRQMQPGPFLLGEFRSGGDALLGAPRADIHPAPAACRIMPDDVAHDAYSHEVSSAGFWPGNGRESTTPRSTLTPRPRRPASPRRRSARRGFWNTGLNEFILPYDAVRTAADPEQTLMEFLISTYEAAASLGKWDRAALECPLGVPGVPREW